MITTLRRIVGRVVSRFRGERIRPENPPMAFVDAREREVQIRPYRAADFEALVEMYDTFDPEQRAQGTPPIGADAIRNWLPDLLAEVNVVARHRDRVVGHVSFVPDGTGRHELAVFVHQEYQRAGIGGRLMAAGLGHAQEEGVQYVWLSVEAWKRDIQRFYGRAGFSVINAMGPSHRMSRTL
ncbi:GNAT family N-acetyltransferase [Halolamina salifodinae]|uniref:Ribosomal protein S18 acetylase RimI-like enzyme n=1 Tax=Halolamina salifodinae TaxID=1202767 RepID=A0A8T4GYD2_9EURY|nr:GNAT family N-acetyltransferase [Halolamina salifodinae]MBP1987143.1 ribosomal protein S18 acetylase RimI-like enzyme [Halolamina salifodinae]